MSLWGNLNQANNAPKEKNLSADSALRGSGLYQNNVPIDAYAKSISLIGASVQDVQNNPRISQPGWILVTTGTGGRAGRVQYETLAVLGSINYIANTGGNTMINSISQSFEFINVF